MLEIHDPTLDADMMREQPAPATGAVEPRKDWHRQAMLARLRNHLCSREIHLRLEKTR